MENLPQTVHEKPSALVRVMTYLFVPIAVVALLPLLLLFVIVLHLLALVYGAHIFAFSFTREASDPGQDLPPPHFIDVQAIEKKALPDESRPPQKG